MVSTTADISPFDPTSVALTTVDPRDVICFFSDGGNNYDRRLGARISAIFVILVTSTLATLFRCWLRALIASLYRSVSIYSHVALAPASLWQPHISICSIGHTMRLARNLVFLVDFLADRYVESRRSELLRGATARHASVEEAVTMAVEYTFREQIAAFLVLVFSIIFHSVIIGLNLGVVGADGIIIRHSVPQTPQLVALDTLSHVWAHNFYLNIIGLGLSTSYDSGSFTANVVSGVLDAISAGMIIYTRFVELLARDFLIKPNRTRDYMRIPFMLDSLFLL
ncbi:hypothetical protein TrVFT333_009356 [Trichoderma virens FT-333]|nr:hypothetical protein TrVFT333_009356 [Trichoderma virens FT-333]